MTSGQSVQEAVQEMAASLDWIEFIDSNGIDYTQTATLCKDMPENEKRQWLPYGNRAFFVYPG